MLMKQYFTHTLGIKSGNIIEIHNASMADMVGVFGNSQSHQGQLFNYTKPQKSRVYIYYVGHGAPSKQGDAYLVPIDSRIENITLTGYPISTLYHNLSQLPATSITLIMEACFSGISHAGSLYKNASPIHIVAKQTAPPKNIKVISAGTHSQLASWDKYSNHSLFTKYYLKAMSGEADKNKDTLINDQELEEYLQNTLTYEARRFYGREQTARIQIGQ